MFMLGQVPLEDRTAGHWSLLQVIPDLLVCNEAATFDTQDLPCASLVEYYLMLRYSK